MDEFTTWGEALGAVASDLIRCVHKLNEAERTPAIEQLQRALIELSCVLWNMADRMLAAGRCANSAEVQA